MYKYIITTAIAITIAAFLLLGTKNIQAQASSLPSGRDCSWINYGYSARCRDKYNHYYPCIFREGLLSTRWICYD